MATHPIASTPAFVAVALPGDHAAVVEFLCGDRWPFHRTERPTPDDVARMAFVDAATESHWILVDGERAGLIRLLDLDDVDVDEGAPVFDVRLASSRRGHGLGVLAVRWLTDHLFDQHEELHRIEATTRADNLAMQRVLDRCGYTREGSLRESWPAADGRRHDTLVYGVLRSDPRQRAG